MNELLLKLQDTFAAGGDLWTRPTTWICIGCGVIVLLIVGRMMFRRRREEQPLSSSTTHNSDGGAFGSLTEALATQLPESQKERQEFRQMLRQAGLYTPTARASVYAFRFLFMVFPLIVAGILAVFSPQEQTWRILIGGGVAAMALSIIPRLYVYVRKQRRLAEINQGLADMLDMLSMCLSGGMPLASSLDHVAKNLTNYPALAEELQIMKKQTEVHSLRLALGEWASRLDTPEVRQVATMLQRGDHLGSSISGTLRDQADHFRTARKQLATMHANRTPVFLTFPLMFCFAPAVLILLMSPALLQVSDFFNPGDGANALSTNDAINTGRIVNTLNSLEQNSEAIRAATATGLTSGSQSSGEEE